MQIFALDENPIQAAKFLADQHIVKMVLESAQILSTVVGLEGMYRPTHFNHPCTKWVRESIHNRAWLRAHGLAIGQEFALRGRTHASVRIIEMVPEEGNWRLHTPFAQAMDPVYQRSDGVEAYRNFYQIVKKEFATPWGTTEPAKWDAPRARPFWL